MPPVAKVKKSSGAPKAPGTVRAKSGCYTCRIRRKKCDESPNEDGYCQTCVRLKLQCLGFGAKRPDWLRETRRVVEIREKIKTFLASQGMIKGHSGTGPRSVDQEQSFLPLSDDYGSSSDSPPTPTLSLSSTDEQHSFHHTSHVRGHSPWSTSLPPINTHYGGPTDLAPPHSLLRPSSPYVSHNETYAPYNSYSHTSSSNSLVSQPFCNPNTLLAVVPPPPASSPALLSSFSSTYTTLFAMDEWDDTYDTNVANTYNDDNSPTSSLSMMMMNPFFDDLLCHYVQNVIEIEYLLADKHTLKFISQQLIAQNMQGCPTVVGDAVRLLAAVHRNRCRASIQALEEPSLKNQYRALQPLLLKETYTTDEAFAALQIISAFLFDGGTGYRWHRWLKIACAYSDSILYDPRYTGPVEALFHADETVTFVVKTTMWFDVLASVTLNTAPHFLNVFRLLFDPSGARIEATMDGPSPLSSPVQKLSMMSVMGCENDIVWAMSEVSALAQWKQEQEKRGCLSIPLLVQKGQEIEKYLTPLPRNMVYEEEIEVFRHYSSEIFRSSARVYLHSVVSGDRPAVDEIKRGVKDTIDCLSEIPETGAIGISRSVVRMTVFSIFICGCLTDDLEQRSTLMMRLKQQQTSEKVGNCDSVTSLLQNVWAQRDKGPLWQEVPWRDALNKAEMLLV